MRSSGADHDEGAAGRDEGVGLGENQRGVGTTVEEVDHGDGCEAAAREGRVGGIRDDGASLGERGAIRQIERRGDGGAGP